MAIKAKRSAKEAFDDELESEEKRFKEVVEKKEADTAVEMTESRLRFIEKQKDLGETRGVIYIGHLPHGFYEEQLRKYFAQFGEVTRVRVSRSRKTGGSRGYAFVEFLHDSVAKVAAESMNNYLMFERILKCHVVPKEKVHHDMFSPRFPFPLNREITKTFLNMERTEARVLKNQKLRMERLQKQMEALKDMGITYIMEPVGAEGLDLSAPLKNEDVAEESDAASDSDSSGPDHTLLVDSEDDEVTFKVSKKLPPKKDKDKAKAKDKGKSIKSVKKASMEKSKRGSPKQDSAKKRQKRVSTPGSSNKAPAAGTQKVPRRSVKKGQKTL